MVYNLLLRAVPGMFSDSLHGGMFWRRHDTVRERQGDTLDPQPGE